MVALAEDSAEGSAVGGNGVIKRQRTEESSDPLSFCSTDQRLGELDHFEGLNRTHCKITESAVEAESSEVILVHEDAGHRAAFPEPLLFSALHERGSPLLVLAGGVDGQ